MRQGLGFALLPDWLVARSIEAGDLVVWLPEWQIQGVERAFAVWFVYPPKRIVSSKVRCFIDFIVERLGETRTGNDSTEANIQRAQVSLQPGILNRDQERLAI